MRMFKIPYDIPHEEKIFKGIVSLRQAFYLAGCIATIGVLFFHIPLIIKIILMLLLNTFCLLCAFFKVNGNYFDKHLVYLFKYVKREKKILFTK